MSVTAALIATAAPNASAANFQLGDFDITFDSTFSLGTSIRVENRDWDSTVGKANGPSFNSGNLCWL